MNFKKAAISVPLSLSLLLPVAANSASAHELIEEHNGSL
jgi:hypothetical protein